MDSIFTSSDFITYNITAVLGNLVHLVMDAISAASLALGRI